MAVDVGESFEWTELIPGGFIVYYADGDEEILHVNQYVLDMFECEDVEEFMELTDGSFRGFVHDTDVASTEDSIWGQLSKRSGLDHIYYRVRTKSGKILSVDDYGRLVRSEGDRPMFYVFVVELDQDSAIDWLTGLPGVDRFVYVASIELDAMIVRGESPCVLVFDLMGMRTFNATNGRSEGDRLLCTFASILRRHFGSELCCRYAGDSFCTLTTTDGLTEHVESVFQEFGSPGPYGGLPVMAGACEVAPGDELPLVLDRAKFACDSDRSTWESHLSWFTNTMRKESRLRAHVLEHVDQAIEEGWVRPHYQGIVRSATGDVCGAEALARWSDPKYGDLMPAQFIPALEEAGLLRKLDLHMVRCVVADLAKSVERGGPVLSVSVNLSLRDLVDPDIASVLAQTCDGSGVDRRLLHVEFTESAASRDPELLKSQMNALHKAGFEVWMDDFGSGFSSLNVLKEFDFDLIKLDMGFVSKGYESKREVIVDGVIRAAKRIGVRTLAEGVETAELAQELAAMGCDMLQGFHFFRPMPVSEVVTMHNDPRGIESEPIGERRYWNTVGSVSLADLAAGLGTETLEGQQSGPGSLPAGILERRNGSWRLPRSTESLRRLLAERGVIPPDAPPMQLAKTDIELDEAFHAAVVRCKASGTWERMTGPWEYGSGYQFRVRPLDTCKDAGAYVLASTPTLLGAGLGTYGDVPMGYAVLRMIYGADDKVVDAEYVYANALFCEWGHFNEATIVGMTLKEIVPSEGEYWLGVCSRAVVDGTRSHDVVYGTHAGHWLSYSVMPSLVEGHCIFAFAIADAEQREREKLIQAGTHDPLTGLLNRRGIDEEIERRMRERPTDPAVLALLDVDDFKTINDLYGHDVGDEALRVLSRKLVQAFPSTAVVGRNGGDELLVALFGKDAGEIEERMARLLASNFSFDFNGHRYAISISAGYAWCHAVDELAGTYTRADEALYAVKLSGKSGYREWEPGLREIPGRSLLGFTMRDIAEGMPLAMLAHRRDGQILFANEGLSRLLGYNKLSDVLENVGENMRGIICADDWDEFQSVVDSSFWALLSDGERETGLRIVNRYGDVLRVVYRMRLVSSREKGDIIYAYMVEESVLKE